MSRTKGSLNKKTKGSKNIKKKYRRRGRPKGSTKVAITKEKVYDDSNVKRYKFLGYCKCETLISEKELKSKTIYECPGCGKSNRVSKLVKELTKEKFTNKKDYLSNTIHANHYESLPLNAPQMTSKDLKVQE